MTVYLVLLFVLLVLSAFFSSSETAFLSLERVQLEHYVRERRAGAARVSAMLDRPGRLLSAILMGNNLVNTGAAAVGTVIATELVSQGQAALAATVVITILLVIFGEIGPKTIALQHNWALTRAYAAPLMFWARAMRPVVAALDLIGRLMVGAVGTGTASGRALSPGELRTAIALGAESGTLDEGESDMLLGALTLQERPVRRIMVHRVTMVTAEAKETLREVSARMAEHGFLRLPVYSGEPDQIVGYVHVSDLNAVSENSDRDKPVRMVMREAVFESELTSIARVLELMRSSGAHMIILVDEFGATAGLVTLEDILEELVGEIASESGGEPGAPDIHIGDFRVVEGVRGLADLGDELGTDLTHTDAETVGGLVLTHLRHFPQPGEAIEYGGYRFTVNDADDRRVTLVAVEQLAAPPEPTDGDGE
ncbi:MAG TPA: hemolysin family protein [Dehalococcoidia bacterium]|nr:hemolysin family protein [Dehalococcoidia bacterium]